MDPLTIEETLIKTKDLLSDKNRWIKGAFCDVNGHRPPSSTHYQHYVDDPTARFCIGGALAAFSVYKTDEIMTFLAPIANEILEAHNTIDVVPGPGTVVFLNDDIGHDAVIQLLEKGIAKAAELGM